MSNASGSSLSTSFSQHACLAGPAYTYTAFGQKYGEIGAETVTQRYTFTGREAAGPAAAAGGAPMYYRYRMYSPSLGRFGRRDPRLGGDALYNAYGHPGSDGVNYGDSFGMTRKLGDTKYKSCALDSEEVLREAGSTFLPRWLSARIVERLGLPTVRIRGTIATTEYECDDFVDRSRKRKRCATVGDLILSNASVQVDVSVQEALSLGAIGKLLTIIRVVQGGDIADAGIRATFQVRDSLLRWDGCAKKFLVRNLNMELLLSGYGSVQYGIKGSGYEFSADMTVGRLKNWVSFDHKAQAMTFGLQGAANITIDSRWDYSSEANVVKMLRKLTQDPKKGEDPPSMAPVHGLAVQPETLLQETFKSELGSVGVSLKTLFTREIRSDPRYPKGSWQGRTEFGEAAITFTLDYEAFEKAAAAAKPVFGMAKDAAAKVVPKPVGEAVKRAVKDVSEDIPGVRF